MVERVDLRHRPHVYLTVPPGQQVARGEPVDALPAGTGGITQLRHEEGSKTSDVEPGRRSAPDAADL
ncbi:MAG: hypothetical protein ACRDRK_06665 [Pseudonocardia sp.]